MTTVTAILKSSKQHFLPKIVSEYDQEIPQSHTADNPMAPQILSYIKLKRKKKKKKKKKKQKCIITF